MIATGKSDALSASSKFVDAHHFARIFYERVHIRLGAKFKQGGGVLVSLSHGHDVLPVEVFHVQLAAAREFVVILDPAELIVGTQLACDEVWMVVPEATLPDQVDVELNGVSFLLSDQLDGGQVESAFTFDVGMDLSTVEQPRELGSHDLVFPTSEGDKTVGMQRFTASDLGTVMVVRNDNVWTGEPLSAGSTYGPADGVLSPSMLKVTDDQGNVLTPVGAGDGSGMNPDEAQIIEFANLSSQATSVTFTPMLATFDGESASVEERKALLESNEQSVDVSHVGTKLAMSEYGGYELTGWDVSDGTVSLSLRPYGWLPDTHVELIPQQEVTNLYSDWTNLETGETGVGAHSAIRYMKNDYRTGERVQMDSYYAATDEELRGLTQYSYRSSFGAYREEADAAAILAFN